MVGVKEGLQTADCGLRTADCGLRTADGGRRTADCGLQTTGRLGIKYGLSISEYKTQTRL